MKAYLGRFGNAILLVAGVLIGLLILCAVPLGVGYVLLELAGPLSALIGMILIAVIEAAALIATDEDFAP